MRSTDAFRAFNDSQRQALDASRNLAVRAGAGSGKTSVLVERIVQILARSLADGEPLTLGSLAALTFTRKAAAEFQDRLRVAFQKLAAAADEEGASLYWTARVAELPRAMIGTIDGFCARTVREFGHLAPPEQRIEPDFEPVQGYDAQLLRREAVDRLLNRLTVADDDVDALASAASHWWGEHEGYDALIRHLLALLGHLADPERLAEAQRDLPPPAARAEAVWEALPAVRLLRAHRDELRATMVEMVESLLGAKKPTKTQTELAEKLTTLLGMTDSQQDNFAFLLLLREVLLTGEREPRSTRNFGPAAETIAAMQETWAAALATFDFDRDGETVACEAADHLARLVLPAHQEYRRLCHEANRWDFTSVARAALALVRDRSEAHSALKERYRYVMVDEFQDTNPLQWEILAHIVGDGPDGPLDADRLFVVGDPQQSIYRFRQADVSVFRRVQELIRTSNIEQGRQDRPTHYDDFNGFATSSDEQRLGIMPLRENYRSLTPQPLGLLDRVFSHVFDASFHHFDPQLPFQVEYQQLESGLSPGQCGEVRYLLPSADDGEPSDDEAAGEEAADGLRHVQVMAVLDQLVDLHGKERLAPRAGEPATLAWRDMAVLLPSRTVVLTELEREFRRRNVPYVVTSGIGFWQRPEVRDVVNLALALADGGDGLSLFAVLRGPLGQRTDTEILFLSYLGNGRLEDGLRRIRQLESALANLKNETMRQVLRTTWETWPEERRQHLRQCADRIEHWRGRVDRLPHADLLRQALEQSGAWAIFAADEEATVALANLERLFDVIREEEGRSAPDLSRLARRLRDRMDDSLREEQAALPAGADAVQVMTVHAAKGLEFPVVAVLKMERHADRPGHASLMVLGDRSELLNEDAAAAPADWKSGTIAVRVRHPLRPRETYAPQLLRALRNLDRARQLAESRRLFYVAATRARERLILAGQMPKKKPAKPPQSWQTWFEEALGLTDADRAGGLWQKGPFAVNIITNISEIRPPTTDTADEPAVVMDLMPIDDGAAPLDSSCTEFPRMCEGWRADPRRWWMRYRVHVEERVHTGREWHSNGGLDDEAILTAAASLARRLLVQGVPASDRDHAETLAAHLLYQQSWKEADHAASVVDPVAIRRVAGKALALLGPLRSRKAAAKAIRDLAAVPSQWDVPFSLTLGGWHLRGRIAQLLKSNDGIEVVDWLAGDDTPLSEQVQRHRSHALLLAWALLQSGRAVLNGSQLRVRTVMMQHLQIVDAMFKPEEVAAAIGELELELGHMAAYVPAV